LAIIQVTHDLAEALTGSSPVIALCQGHEDREWLQRQQTIFARDLQQRHTLHRLSAISA
jgi:predicted secreted protein